MFRPANVIDREARLRIAYIVHAFEVGGLERCIARLVNGLDPERFEPMIVCLASNGAAAQWLDRSEVPIIELHRRDGNDPKVVRRLSQVLRQYEIDVVHSHNWATLVETVIARKWARVPWHVHAERGMKLVDPQVGSLRRRLRDRASQWAFRQVDVVVAVAEEIRRRLEVRNIAKASRVQVIPNGVDVRLDQPCDISRHEIRSTLGIDECAILIGSVGRLASVKDFATAIEAVSRLVQEGLAAHLVIVGDGAENQSLRQSAIEAGIDRQCHLVGHQHDVGRWMSTMDIYVNSSINEGMSQSIIEAMAMGLPSVVTQVGDSAARGEGERACGLVVPAKSPTRLAAALKKLALSKDLRQEFGSNARLRHAHEYSLAAMLRNYESLYDGLAGRCEIDRELVSTS